MNIDTTDIVLLGILLRVLRERRVPSQTEIDALATVHAELSAALCVGCGEFLATDGGKCAWCAGAPVELAAEAPAEVGNGQR